MRTGFPPGQPLTLSMAGRHLLGRSALYTDELGQVLAELEFMWRGASSPLLGVVCACATVRVWLQNLRSTSRVGTET